VLLELAEPNTVTLRSAAQLNGWPADVDTRLGPEWTGQPDTAGSGGAGQFADRRTPCVSL